LFDITVVKAHASYKRTFKFLNILNVCAENVFNTTVTEVTPGNGIDNRVTELTVCLMKAPLIPSQEPLIPWLFKG